MDSAAHRQRAFDLLEHAYQFDDAQSQIGIGTMALAHFEAARLRGEEEQRVRDAAQFAAAMKQLDDALQQRTAVQA